MHLSVWIWFSVSYSSKPSRPNAPLIIQIANFLRKHKRERNKNTRSKTETRNGIMKIPLHLSNPHISPPLPRTCLPPSRPLPPSFTPAYSHPYLPPPPAPITPLPAPAPLPCARSAAPPAPGEPLVNCRSATSAASSFALCTYCPSYQNRALMERPEMVTLGVR